MDRMPELKAAAAKFTSRPTARNGDADSSDYSPANADADEVRVRFEEPPSEGDAEAAETLAAFIQDTELVLGRLAIIERLSGELQNVHAENMQTIDEARSRALRNEIDRITAEINTSGIGVKEALDTMAKGTAKLKESDVSTSANTALIRIEENQHQRLLMKLAVTMQRHQQLQVANELSYKAQTKRRIKINYTNSDGSAIDDATVEQLTEQVMENNAVSYIFQQSKDVLASIIETRNDIYRIERSMQELNQLFSDLAFLVNEQGEIMDVILSNIQRSTRYVEAGRKELKKARKYQKRSRKKMIILIVCVVIIIVLFIVVGVIAGTIKK